MSGSSACRKNRGSRTNFKAVLLVIRPRLLCPIEGNQAVTCYLCCASGPFCVSIAAMYNDTVIRHFENPQHTGEIEDADAVISVGNPECGDMMKLYIKVANDRIADIRYKTFGCAAAIATSSAGAGLALGRTLDEAAAISSQDIVDALGGLPQKKILCSTLFPEAIRQAVAQYRGE